MALKPCLDCGTPTTGTRCPTHTRAADARRGTPAQRGYDAAHRAERREWQRLITAGTVLTCTRCGQPLRPGQRWDLDHRPHGSFPAHAHCNRSAGGRGEP